MNRTFRFLIRGVIFVLLVSAVAGSQVHARTVLQVWAMGAEGKLIREMADEYERQHPEIQIVTQAIPWSGAHEKLVTSVIGEIPPDICQLGTTWMSEFRAMDAIEPLDEYLKKSRLIRESDFFSSALDTGRFDGKIYGVPWYVDSRVFFYRKDIVSEAGFKEFPKTWKDMTGLMRSILELKKRKGMDGYAISLPFNDWQIFLPFIWQNGGDVLSADCRKSVIHSENTIEALKYFKSFFNLKATSLEASKDMDLFNAFETGFFPIFVSGPWMISEINKNKPGLEGRWTTARFPEKLNYTSFIGGSNLVLFRQSSKKAEAWKFIEFMSTAENQIRWYQISRNLPSNTRSWDHRVMLENTHLNAFREQLKQAKSPPNIPEWEQIAATISEIMESVMYGTKTEAQGVAEMDSRIKRIIQKTSVVQSVFFKVSVILLIISAIAFSLVCYLNRKPMTCNRGGSYNYGAFLFLLPSILILITFLCLPIIASFIISLTNWNIYAVNDLNRIVFTGAENYLTLFSDRIFWISLRNTLVFAFLGVPLNIVLALVTAVIINQGFIRFKALFRIGFFIPVITTMVAVAVVWRWLYNPEFGVFNWLLGLIGIAPQNWLSDSALALPSLILMGVWKGFGYNMIIFIAALQSIPDSLYEASEIDGASPFQQFIHITMPMLKKTIFFIGIMTTIGFLQFFAEPYIMTSGGPLNSTMSVVLYMYNQGFKYYNLGYASAIAYVLFGIILMFTFFQYRISKKFDL